MYPVVVALLVGFALSRGPDRPKVAVLNQVPPGERVQIGGQQLAPCSARRSCSKRVDAVRRRLAREAERKVRDGDVLGALMIPPDTRAASCGRTLERPRVEVLVNEEDPLKARLVEDTIASVVAEANQRVSRALTSVTLRYLKLLLKGGTVNVLGNRVHGPRASAGSSAITRAARRELPRRLAASGASSIR